MPLIAETIVPVDLNFRAVVSPEMSSVTPELTVTPTLQADTSPDPNQAPFAEKIILCPPPVLPVVMVPLLVKLPATVKVRALASLPIERVPPELMVIEPAVALAAMVTVCVDKMVAESLAVGVPFGVQMVVVAHVPLALLTYAVACALAANARVNRSSAKRVEVEF